MTKSPVDGILNVNKPSGITSMDLVRRVKRASGQKHVGHGGTLDPVATGVVPICFGQATRMMEYLIDSSKEYRAVVELGVTTDSYDSLGEITGRQETSGVTLEDIEQALESFKGVIQQVPPMYSALKKEGKRLYDLARAGIEVEREARRVTVYGIKLIDWSSPLVTLEVSCGRGFYMRSLAHDLGQAIGCGGHLKSLVRTRGGAFRIEDSLTLEQAEESFEDDTWRDVIHSPDVVLYNLRAIIVGKRVEDMIRNGRSLPPAIRIPRARPDEKCRVYTVDGRFLAVLLFDSSIGQWRPEKVFSLRYLQTAGVV
jgi:tRNA pseudouridine55 synthase